MKSPVLFFILFFAASPAFSQTKAIGKKNDIKLFVRGMSSDNKISKTSLSKLDTLTLTGTESENFRIKSMVLSRIFMGNVKEAVVPGAEALSFIKAIAGAKDVNRIFLDRILIKNDKTNEEFQIPPLKIILTD